MKKIAVTKEQANLISNVEELLKERYMNGEFAGLVCATEFFIHEAKGDNVGYAMSLCLSAKVVVADDDGKGGDRVAYATYDNDDGCWTLFTKKEFHEFVDGEFKGE
jgi:hypothetical protein